MSASDSVHESSAPTPEVAAPAPVPKSANKRERPPRRGVGLAGLALVLALIALLAAAYGGWRLWRVQQGGAQDTRALADMHAQLKSLGDKLDALGNDTHNAQQQAQAAQQQGQSLTTQVQGLSERSRSLENAVAGLTAREQSGHDAVRLDEAAMLLRMAGERFALFHDADGAMQAYAMADRVMAEVEDPAYAAVRQSIDRERQALAGTHPGQRQGDLDTLARLRSQVGTLPLKPLDAPVKNTGTGFWARVKHAFAGLVQIQRDDGVTPAHRALAQSLTALDLAQAQAALLAWNPQGYQDALAQADMRLQTDFDGNAQAVHDMRAQIAQLRERATPQAPELGAALSELNNLRAVHEAAAPAASASAKGAQR
ncbi:uroporphyrinogen-III C-methyltransferase [Oleiagrimonas soli]|uniref:Uroporphyrin-3 C-methyltransferase n=1 Tax=Oleiagrimonas soli TaxID=1543381 RepID=A0A099D0V3_9GAMM|nr:uroporphyrinogen-III C-methyltransferase [Oleiagrimonas soli]KGI78920.1 hypothetical protein LF63_0102030 [Oleiagrimonas soli]MBB6184480.1 uroporphyrin-3 C-methyltransferase [Oleiagrimonas soli]